MNYLAARHANRVLTVSENSKRDLVTMLGVASSKISVVYPGVSDLFRPHPPSEAKQYVRVRYGLPTQFILAPGGLGANKNLSRLLAAFAKIVSQGCKHDLVCTGTASIGEMRQLRRLVNDLNLTGKVFFPGCIPQDDLPKLYAASSAVIYVSLYEGFGLPLLEAMACGIPIIASKASSIPEVTQDAAVLVDPYDCEAIATAVRRVLSEEQLRAAMIQKGLIRAQHFNWTNTATRTIEEYRAAIQQFRSAHVGPMMPVSRAA
jgi:glycosyltransferase involved in cell wall biosynthesis